MDPHKQEEHRKFVEQLYKQPFIPNPNAGTEQRAANALEYIAAVLGQINAKLDQLLKDKEGPYG